MKIGIDIRKPDWSEGQQRYLWRLGCWMSQRGHCVHFINALPGPAQPSLPTQVEYHGLGTLSRADVRKTVRSLGLDALLLNPEKSRRYGGIAANVLRPGYGTEHYRQKIESFRTPISRAIRLGLRGTPPVLIAKRRERRFYQREGVTPEVIAMSGLIRSAVIQSYGVEPDRLHHVPNGIDLTRFCPDARADARSAQRARWGIPSDALCLLFMGHNFRLKGLSGLLRVMARLQSRGEKVRLLAAGKGTGRSQWRQARREIRKLGCEDVIQLTGPIRPASHAFAAADILLHPSWHDAFGNVVLEAMACGLPVITTPRIGAAELIEDGVSGVLTEPDDLDSIEAAILHLRDPVRREKLGAAARQVAESHGEEENFRQILSVFEVAAARARCTVG